MKFMSKVLVVVIIMAIISNALIAFDLFGRGIDNVEATAGDGADYTDEQLSLKEKYKEWQKKEDERRKSGVISFVNFDKGDMDTVVTGEDNLLQALNNMQTGLGINFETEYKTSNVVDEGDEKIYTIDQYYKDTRVNGCSLKVAVNKSGMITSVDGIHPYIDNVEESADYDEETARKRAEQYLVSEHEYNLDDIEITSKGRQIALLDDRTTKCGYFFQISCGKSKTGIRLLFVDEQNGKILIDQSNMFTDRKMINLPGQKVNQSLYVDFQPEYSYSLQDDDTKLMVYDFRGKYFDCIKEYEAGNLDVVAWEDDENDEWIPNIDKSCVDALANLERTYDAYKEIFGRIGMKNDENAEKIPVFINIKELANNAMTVGNRVLAVGPAIKRDNTCSEALDVMAHEFTHGVIFTDVIKDETESWHMETMNEGLADVFGEIVEDYSDDKKLNGSCDWVHTPDGSNRSLISPEKNQKTVARDYDNIGTDCHQGIYLTSHPFYLMHNGFDGTDEKKIDNEKLAYLYYDMFSKLSAQSTFSSFRRLLESRMYTGLHKEKYELTDKQKECVMDSLDNVGMPRNYDYSLTPNASLNIYDIYMDKYQDCNVVLQTIDGGMVVRNGVPAGGVYTLPDCPAGIYSLSLEDKNSRMKKSFIIAVNDNGQNPIEPYQENADLFTSFGSKEGNIALVIDVSGSMADQPIEQVKAACMIFVDTLKSKAPNVHVSLIAYNSKAWLVNETGKDLNLLEESISALDAGSGTNMCDAFKLAEEKLSGKTNKAVVIMSDGLPNEGENVDGDYIQAVKNRADHMKQDGTFIYSFGFFHNSSGEELMSGQDLMKAIANKNYSTIVTDAKSDAVSDVFNYIAFQIANPGKTTHMEFHCPVDISVSYNGQRLDSSENGRNTGTDFGILTFGGENGEEKILNLKNGPDYEVIVKGTDSGSMDYSIAFADDEGEYIDERNFKAVPVTEHTLMVTNAGSAKETSLRVDEDGDGKYENVYVAGENGTGEIKNTDFKRYVKYTILVVMGVLIVVLAYFEIRYLMRARKEKKEVKCPSCGRELKEGSLFCSYCGIEIPALEKTWKSKRTWRTVGIKAAVILILMLEIYGADKFYNSAVVSTYNQVKTYNYEMAGILYENHIKEKKIASAAFDFMMDRYIDKVDSSYKKGKINERTVSIIRKSLGNLGMGSISEKAIKRLTF